jgi:hypothetical protein
MNSLTRAFYFLLLAPFAWTNCLAQTNLAPSAPSSEAANPAAPLHVTPIHTTHREVFSGISDPGQPVSFEKPADGSWTRNNIAQEGASLLLARQCRTDFVPSAAFYNPDCSTCQGKRPWSHF